MRPDGRDSLQLRALACETKTLSMLDGSARYSHQGSCVLASVAGPIEAVANKQGERAHVQVCVARANRGPALHHIPQGHYHRLQYG
jgi:ribonuclease PH